LIDMVHPKAHPDAEDPFDRVVVGTQVEIVD
jgi:lipoprotein-anchoring transpeptidase ErfK/SrfK